MNRKNGEYLGIFALLTLFSTRIVSAGPIDGIRDILGWSGEIIVIIIRFISDLLLDIDSFDQYLFAKVLLFSIIYLVTYSVLRRNDILGSRRSTTKIISAAIGILSIRFLEEELIDAILLPYSALGVALTTFFPFVIYFFFIHQSGVGPFGRRAGWMVLALSFSAIWAFRYKDLGKIVGFVYGLALIFIVISLIFDRSIHKYFGMSQFNKVRRGQRRKARRRLMKELDELEEGHARGRVTPQEYRMDKRELEERIRELHD